MKKSALITSLLAIVFILYCLSAHGPVHAQVLQTSATLGNANVFTAPNYFTLGLDSGPAFFANLSSISSTGATFVRCLDCQQTDPCIGGGSGALWPRSARADRFP